MSSGHASHKGKSIKPNTNANHQLDVDPEEIPTEEGYAFDREAPINPVAVERPKPDADSSFSDDPK